MNELLAKIRESKDKSGKCALIAQVFEQLNVKLENLSSDVDAVSLDVAALDTELDHLDAIGDELTKILNPELQKVLKFLKPRFEAHMYRHKNITWEQVEQRLREADPKKIWSLNEMERTGREPDVVGMDKKTGELIFQDRSPEVPIEFGEETSCLYDKAAEEDMKEYVLNEISLCNAIDMAAQMGVELLDEKQYIEAQKVDKLDQKCRIWIKTPVGQRKKNIALRGGRDNEGAFVVKELPTYRNEAMSWRGSLKV